MQRESMYIPSAPGRLRMIRCQIKRIDKIDESNVWARQGKVSIRRRLTRKVQTL